MKKTLTNLALYTAIATGVASLTACSVEETFEPYTLPNGEVISVHNCTFYGHQVKDSKEFPGSKTFLPKTIELCKTVEDLSRIEGVIEYIGPVKKDKEAPEIVHQVAVGGSGILAGGDASNNYETEQNLVVKVNSELGTRLMYVKPNKEGIPAGILYSLMETGDRVSFPTVRNFDYDCRSRTLRDIDHYYPEELKLVMRAEIDEE